MRGRHPPSAVGCDKAYGAVLKCWQSNVACQHRSAMLAQPIPACRPKDDGVHASMGSWRMLEHVKVAQESEEGAVNPTAPGQYSLVPVAAGLTTHCWYRC